MVLCGPLDTPQSPNEVFTSKAMIQRPAPPFEGKAVVDGEFKTIRLSDYLGASALCTRTGSLNDEALTDIAGVLLNGSFI